MVDKFQMLYAMQLKLSLMLIHLNWLRNICNNFQPKMHKLE